MRSTLKTSFSRFRSGLQHGLPLNIKVKIKLDTNDKGDNEKATDSRLQAVDHEIGADWKKSSDAGGINCP